MTVAPTLSASPEPAARAAGVLSSGHVEALVAGSIRLDGHALAARVQHLAERLRAAGIHTGLPVAIALESRAEAMIAIIACRQLGAAYVPLDPDFPEARLAAMLAAARPALILVDASTKARFAGHPAILDITGTESAIADLGIAEIAAEGIAYILFTSGSTGTPKGVAMRASAVDHLIAWHVDHPRLGRAARTLQFAPLGFDVSYQEIFSTLATGGCLVLPDEAERRDPYALLALLQRERVERLFLPYVGLQALAEAVAAGGEPPHGLRDVITAGEQLRITPALRALFAALPDCVLHNHYGPTETHVVTAFELAGDPADWPELPSIGQPLPHVRIAIVDAQSNAIAGNDEGELLLGGDCLAAGYANAPELTAERFIERDGARWYRTGDRVRRAGDGNLDYLGRLDTQIKLDGFRVEPAEIEIVLGRHADVAEVAVVATSQAGTMQLVAHVVPRDPASTESTLTDSIQQHAAAHLAPYLLPQRFLIHAALPLTPNGKIDRHLLAQSAGEQPLAWPDDASLEVQVTLMWQQLLGAESIAAHDNLFDRGARSLTVVRALTHLRKRGHVLSAAQVYEHPTIAGQLALLGSHDQRDAGVAAASRRGVQQRQALNRFGPPGGRR